MINSSFSVPLLLISPDRLDVRKAYKTAHC